MQKTISLFVLLCICASTIHARIPNALIHTGFLTINTMLWDIANRHGQYQTLLSLPQEQSTQLYNAYEQAITDATYRNAKPMVRWIPSSILRRHLPEDDGTYIRNIQQYFAQCAAHTIMPESRASTALTMLPAIATIKRMMPAMIACRYGAQAISTALHAYIAYAPHETLRAWSRPVHDQVYHTTHDVIKRNPALFDTIVQTYCQNNYHNPHIRNWMQPPQQQHAYTPVHAHNQTYYVSSSFISAALRAAAGNNIRPQLLTDAISQSYSPHDTRAR